MNEQQKQNLQSILERANVMIDARKREMVEDGDIEGSIYTANRQAQIQQYFKKHGVEISAEK